MNRTHSSLLALALAGGTFTLAAQDAPKAPAPAAPATNAPAKSVTITPGTAAPAATTAPAAAARNIRFQFDGIPYADVIERFAQMANKPLLAGNKPEGTLTYNDPNAYSYAEALDTLNVVLAMKGVMLVENANYLQLVPFKELPSTPLKLLRGAAPTGDVRPGEVVTAVLDAKNVDSKEITDSLTAMLSNAGSMAVLPRGRGIIITDRLANIQRVKALLATIDIEAPAERMMKTFAMQNTSGAIVADLLNRTFGLATAPRRQEFNPTTKTMVAVPPDPNEYITAVYDDASRTMVLFGPRDRIALAEELIAKFEQREGPAGDVRIYQLQNIKAEELATIVRQAIPGVADPKETGSAAATKARVIADPKDNRLIVASPVAAQLEQIDLLISRVDKGTPGQFGNTNNVALRTQTVQLTKVFRPRATEPKDFAAIITQALTRRDPGGRAGTTASVTFDAASKSVVITGSPGDLQTATEILTQLETGTSQPQPLQTKFIEVGTAADAKRLLPLVEELYRNQMSGAGALDIGAHAKLMSDDNGRLVVTASESHLTRIEELVNQLRGKHGVVLNRQLSIISLKNTKLDAVFAGFEKLLADRMADRRYEGQPKPSVVADNANNRMLVTATPEQLKEIEQLVQVVDLAPATQRREMVVLPVRAKTTTEIIALATQLLAQMGGPGTDPQMEPKLIPDASGKQIILLAAQKDLKRVQDLVTQLDTATTANLARQFRSVDLHARTATELTPLVTQLYQEQLKGQSEPPGGAATVLSDPKNNRIMVSGADAEILRVEAIIRQLDPAGRKPARDETRVIRLRAALAAEISGLVEKSLNAQAQTVKVLVDARSNSLILSGEPDAVEAASKVIQQLDTSGDVQPREMRVMELKQGDATAIAALALPLVTELLKSQRGPEYSPTVKVIADAAANRLIISGPRNELLAVNTIVEQLDQAPEGAGGARVFKLNSADASKIVGVVSNAMVKFDARNQPIRRITVSADRESNSIVVAGTRADLKDAENIIQRLDNEGIDTSNLDKPKAMRLIEVRGDADALATLATRIFSAQSGGRAVTNLVSITANGRRLIVLAPEPMLVQIEALVASLDAKPDELQRELHPIVLKNASATELLPKVTAIYSEQSLGKTQKPATIYADASGTRLNVFGTKQQAESIQQIADTLAGGQPATRETKVIDLGKLAEARRVMALALQLYKDQFAANPQLGAADAQMVSDGVSGRVIVSARADQMKAIEDIFKRLELTPAATAARETRMIEVGSANDVARLLPIVQKLYTEQWKDRPETDPADAQIVADPQGGRVIVTGRPEHVKEIEGILQKLGTAKAKPQARETRLFDLTTASATELAATLKLLYAESAKARFGNLPPDTLIMADTSANRLIAIGEVTELEAVAELVKKLDTTAGQSATARVFKIKSADPAKVAEVLTSSLVRYDAAGRVQKRVTVSVDAKTRTLIVTGDAKELAAVPAIIEQLDQSLGEQPTRKIQTVQLNSATPNTLLSQARKLYDDQIKTQPELAVAELLVMDDASGSQLILAGNDAQLALFSKILDGLHKLQPAPSERATKMFDLGPADEVTRLVPLVRSLYEERWRTRPLSDPADATFLPDTRNGRVIVTGRTNHIAEIEAILAQVRGPAASEVRETRFFDLTSGDAIGVAATLKLLYAEQARLRPGATATSTLIMAETNSNRIVVTGATNEVAAVEGLVKELNRTGSQAGGARVFKLKSADPDQVTALLTNALVKLDYYGRPQKRVNVVVDGKNRSLIVTGEARDVQAAGTLIEQLEAAPAGTNAVRSMRVFALKGRRATETAPKIRQVFEERARSEPQVGTAGAVIVEDIPGNQLIFVGTEAQLALMQETADVMDKAGTTLGREVRVFPLERNSAAAAVVMLNRLFPRQAGTADREDRMLISAGGDDNTLIVDATRSDLEKIEQLVRVMDAAPAGDKTTFHAVHLTKGKAEEVATAVTASFTAKLGRNKLPRTTVTPVTGANTLLINGPNGEVEDVLKIIQALDVEMKGDEIEIRIYKLENGTAKEVSVIIEQLLQGVSRTRARAAAINVAVDPRANSLIISGTPAHFRVVEKVLPTLDKAPERSDRDVQFVWLKKAKAFEVSTKLEALFSERPKGEQPLIEPDVMNNSLTVIAKRADLAQIQDLIARLDEQSKDNSIQVRLRPLDRVVAEQMAKMLQSIYPQMSRGTVRVVEKLDPLKPATTNAPAATPATNAPANPPAAQAQATPVDTNAVPEVVIAVDKNANSLLLSGPASELDNIERIISDLSLNFYSNEAEFRLFPLKDADPIVVARTLNELLRMPPVTVAPQRPGEPVRTVEQPPRITVVAEQRTRSVVVRARPTDFALMESLIKQLDGSGQTAQLDFRSVPLTNAPPEKVLPLVQQMVTQLNLIRPGEPLTVAVDPRSRALLIVAREAVILQVEKMIQSLDKPAPYVEAEVMVFALKKANAAALALVLQNMIRPAAQGLQTPESRELQEQIRRLRVLGDNGEAVTLDLTKPIKIAADGVGGGNRLMLTSTPDNLKALAAVVELMDTPQLVEGVNVRIIKLQHADAASVLTTVQAIFTQGRTLAAGPGGPGAQPEGLTGKALVNPIGIGVDARSNTLILSGQTESIELASKLIEDLDKQLDHPVTEVKLFRLKHASATRLVAMLQSVFAEGAPVPGTEGLKTQVTRLRTLKDAAAAPRTSENAKARAALTIQADDLSNILIVAARSDMLPLIADVIEQLDIPSASGLDTVRIFPLAHAEPAAVQKILADLYAGQRASTVRNEDKPVITLDERTGALIVAGNPKSFGIVEGLLKQLDQKLPFDLRDIRILPLEHADANVVAGTLQKLMDARLTQRVTLNKGQSDALKVIVLADQRSNALLVGGGRDGFEMVEALAKQLDTAGAALSGRIRLIPLQFADARLVGATLTTLFDQRYAAARTTDVQRNKPVILPDPRSNSLLITANQEDNRTIDELLQKLDTRMDNPSLQLTVLPLKHNDAARVGAMIESIFAARRTAQVLPGQPALPSTQIKLEPDALNNSLVVSASKENLELIQDLLKKLDAEPAIAGGVLAVFTLQFADAARVGAMLSSLVQQGLYRPGQLPGTPRTTPADKLAVSVDPRSNTLFVSASPETMTVVREVIKRMDTQEQAVTGDVRLFQLKHARASSLATTLTQFFTAKEASDAALAVNANQRRVKATVIADDRVNTLLVTGGKEAFDFVERILPQLDGEGTFTKLNFRVFALKKATAQKLQATLQPIFANRPPRVQGQPNDPITIIADSWVNALLVGANVEDMSTVDTLIKQLDAEPAWNGFALHVFPLAKADVRKVALTVQGLFRDAGVQVTADERINALIVSCGEVDAQRIGELVKRLDTEQVARVTEIKVFPLKNARAETLSTILNTALNTKPAPLTDQQNPNAQSVLQFITRTMGGRDLITAALKESVLITPDPRMNSLIVSGPVDYMGLLEQIITRLDASSPQEAKIKVFALKNSSARAMADILTQMFRMTATATTASQRTIQYTLVRPGGTNDAASATLGTAEQAALTVTVDPRTNSLLVGGTDHYVAMVEQIIESLDTSTANDRRTEVVRLKNTQAIDVAGAVRAFLDQERQRVTQVLGVDAVGAAQQMLEREVAVVGETNSNTLLLSASPRYFTQVQQLIAELDKSQPQVMIQVLLAEVALTGGNELGLEWTHKNSPYTVGADLGLAKAVTGSFTAALTGGDLNFLLRALKSDGKLEVLSRPQIVTADNKPATINIGQRVPLITDSRVTERGDTINSFRYEDIGVNLTVTPKISPDGFVKLDLGTTNSSISSSEVKINASATVQIINQRRANTTVSVQNGQTIIIGGLIGTQEDKRVRKVPYLGDIPYLGAAFRTTTISKEKRELLIFLTPNILANNQTVVPLTDPNEATREELDRSRLNKELKRNDFNRPSLDLIFPPPAAPMPANPPGRKPTGS